MVASPVCMTPCDESPTGQMLRHEDDVLDTVFVYDKQKTREKNVVNTENWHFSNSFMRAIFFTIVICALLKHKLGNELIVETPDHV